VYVAQAHPPSYSGRSRLSINSFAALRSRAFEGGQRAKKASRGSIAILSSNWSNSVRFVKALLRC
jgi:hypothetical protein